MALRNLLSRSTIPGSTSTKRSTSAAVFDQPTETRSEWSASTPIAASTGDGSSVSDEHDDPECTATPCWSSASRIGSASTPSHAEAQEVRQARHRRPPRRSARRSGTSCDHRGGRLDQRALRRRLRFDDRPRRTRRRTPPTRARLSMPAAARPLLRAAHEQRREPQAPAHEQRARALRAAELVRGDRAEVGAERVEVDGNVPGGRARVDVHDAPRARARPRHTGRRPVAASRLRDSRAAPRRAGCRGAIAASDLGRVEPAGPVDADLGHRPTPAAPPRRARSSARPRSSRRGRRPRRPGASAPHTAVFTASVPDDGEHDLAGPGAEERGDLLTRVLERDARRAPLRVEPAGIGVVLAEVRQHRVERDRAQRRRRCVVEVRARQGATLSDAGDAVVVAVRTALLDGGLGLAVEPFEHSLDHAGVDRAQARAGTAAPPRRTGSARRRA